MTPDAVVVVGAGQGGLQAAASLRDAGYQGSLTVIGAEAELPYQRPPLSKAYLTGDAAEETLALRPESFFRRHRIDVRTGDPVVRIDRCADELTLRSGQTLGYDRLILATGTRSRELPVPGADLDGVLALRSLGDAQSLRTLLSHPRHVVVIGGGFIGTEVAAAAMKLGHDVTIVESCERLLSRVVSAEVSAHVTKQHTDYGARILLGATVQELRGTDGQVNSVVLADGDRVAADVVVVGIGAVPNTELAAAAGLAVDNGVLIDGHLRTTDPRISAIGDCAAFPCVHAGGSILRLESVQAAVDHGRHVAADIMGVATAPYAAVPWFWTEQFGFKVQMAGIGLAGDSTTTIGDVRDGSFSVLRFRSGRLACVESVNRSTDHMAARKLLTDPDALAHLVIPEGEPDIDLRGLAKSLAATASNH